jgi:chemotaxis protein histidine kinase CheA
MYDDEPKSAETAETVVTTTTVTTTTTKESADAAPADKPAEVATETVTAETDAPAKPKRLKKTKAEKAAEAKAKAAEKKANAKAKAEAKKAEKAAAKKEKAVTTASGEKKPRKPRASKGGLAKVRDVREGVFYLSGAVIKEFGHTKGISEELIGKFRALRGGLQTKHDIVNYLTRSWHVINGYLHGYTEAMNVKYAEFVEHAEKVADAVPRRPMRSRRKPRTKRRKRRRRPCPPRKPNPRWRRRPKGSFENFATRDRPLPYHKQTRVCRITATVFLCAQGESCNVSNGSAFWKCCNRSHMG